MKDKVNTRVDTHCRATAINVEKRQVRFLSQSAAFGSDRLVILPGAGKRRNKEFMANPIVVPYHMRYDMNAEPIVVGSVVETEFKPDGMYQTVQFAETERGEAYWSLYRDKHMRAVSIAWSRDDKVVTDAKKMDALLAKHSVTLKGDERAQLVGVVTEYRQTDLSLVAIGADPRAMIRAEEAGNPAAGELLEGYAYDSTRGLYLGDPDPAPRNEPLQVAIALDTDNFIPPEELGRLASAVVEAINDDVNRDVNIVFNENAPEVTTYTTTGSDVYEVDAQELREIVRGELTAVLNERGFTDGGENASDDDESEDDETTTTPSRVKPEDGPNNDEPTGGGNRLYAELLTLNQEPQATKPPSIPDDLLDLAKDN